MAVVTAPPTTTAFLNTVHRRLTPAKCPPLRRLTPARKSSRILAMAPIKKVGYKHKCLLQNLVYNFNLVSDMKVKHQFRLNHHENFEFLYVVASNRILVDSDFVVLGFKS